MQKIGFVLLVVAASLFECTDAHGFHHPISNEQDFSFENIVEQKYPTLPTTFISKHRRQLAEDFTHKSGSETVPICDPNCYQNPKNGKWLSCDDLVRILSAPPTTLTRQKENVCGHYILCIYWHLCFMNCPPILRRSPPVMRVLTPKKRFVQENAITVPAHANKRVKMVDPAMNGLVVLHSVSCGMIQLYNCVDARRAI